MQKLGRKIDNPRIKILFIIFLFLTIFLPILLVMGLYWVLNGDFFVMGNSGFIRVIITNICFLILINVIFYLIIKKIINIPSIIVGILMIICFIITLIFFIKPIILDIPYLDNPMTTYLQRLEFDESLGTGDNRNNYYLGGVDVEGKYHSFLITSKKYDEAYDIWINNDFNNYAKVIYLPNTSVVMSFELLDNLDNTLIDQYPVSDDLGDDWTSFSIEINDTTYNLPLNLNEFIDDGWQIIPEDQDIILVGYEELYGSYDCEWISLTNDDEQRIDVMVYNIQNMPITLDKGIVGGIYVVYDNYDFAGVDVRLPKGLMLGWSNINDVLNLYGKPYDRFENHSFTYRNEEYGRMEMTFNDEGILYRVMMFNQKTYKEYSNFSKANNLLFLSNPPA